MTIFSECGSQFSVFKKVLKWPNFFLSKFFHEIYCQKEQWWWKLKIVDAYLRMIEVFHGLLEGAANVWWKYQFQKIKIVKHEKYHKPIKYCASILYLLRGILKYYELNRLFCVFLFCNEKSRYVPLNVFRILRFF